MKNGFLFSLLITLSVYSFYSIAQEPELTSSCHEIDFSLSKINSAARNIRVADFGKSKWIWDREGDPEGIALIIHGLNNKPSSMDFIARRLERNGIKSLRGALNGHRGDIQEMKSVIRSDWQWNVYRSYCLARSEADRLGVPLYFIGNSLGALTFIDTFFQDTGTQIRVDKLLLFAPAIAVKKYAHLIRVVRVFGSRFIVPSKTPIPYRANRGTSVTAYRSLFMAHRISRIRIDKRINIPALIFIDPKDELISIGQLLGLVKYKQLDNWKIHKVSTRGSTLPSSYHHLIIDEASVGSSQWEKMENKMIQFFKN